MGGNLDLLEIMGLQETDNHVKGWLSASDVFERINNHYKGVQK